MQKPKWTFLTNHARVLTHIAKHPKSTTREIALAVGVTERAVQKIIQDLKADGYILCFKEGRNNIYQVNHKKPMRHPMDSKFVVGELLMVLGCDVDSIN